MTATRKIDPSDPLSPFSPSLTGRLGLKGEDPAQASLRLTQQPGFQSLFLAASSHSADNRRLSSIPVKTWH